MFLVASSDACAKTMYLNTGGSSLWEKDNANKFAVWYWHGSNQGEWSTWMTRAEGNVWQTSVSEACDHVIFCRFDNSMSTPDWGDNKVWNKSADLEISSGQNLYTVTDWENGTWSVYGEEPGGGKEPVTPTDYSTAVPSQCEDVMLQAFYWMSFRDDRGFGNTKWATLTGQASEIGTYFDLVWLPPSHEPKDEMGYIASCYSTQSTGGTFGKRNALDALIAALHTNGVRVIADIVINHCGNNNSACNYNYLNFGSFGTFQPEESWMTSDDEGVSRHGCSGGSNADDGQNTGFTNYEAARDWDHQNTKVQNMCKAYLKWMKADIQYDGFRYDYAGGFKTSHINDYNKEAKPYFSVMEYWYDNSASVIKNRIDDAGKNTLAFDFPGRITAFKNGIAKGSYDNCKSAGLRGQGYSKYAVTFIDNHDTFQRTNTTSDILDKTDGSSINNKSVILQCNAYLLSMPGVPCVFYPHWYKYKAEIKKMIEARKKAGIHSESAVTEESGNGYYRATIQGKYGSVKLMLGSAASDAAPAGYTEAIKDSGFAMYYTGNSSWAVEQVNTNAKSEKFLKDGQLFIRCGEKIYDAQGRIVK